jgi:hypothetical protein
MMNKGCQNKPSYNSKNSNQVGFKAVNIHFTKAEHIKDVAGEFYGCVNLFHKILGMFKKGAEKDPVINELVDITFNKIIAGNNKPTITAEVGYTKKVLDIIEQATGTDPYLQHIKNNTSSEVVGTEATSTGIDFFTGLTNLVQKFRADALNRMNPHFYTDEANKMAKSLSHQNYPPQFVILKDK